MKILRKYRNENKPGRKTPQWKRNRIEQLFKDEVPNAAIAERLDMAHTTICGLKKEWQRRKKCQLNS